MCFGSSASGTPTQYTKKSYDPLPSLGTGSYSSEGKVVRKQTKKDLAVRDGKAVRSMLLPYGDS